MGIFALHVDFPHIPHPPDPPCTTLMMTMIGMLISRFTTCTIVKSFLFCIISCNQQVEGSKESSGEAMVVLEAVFVSQHQQDSSKKTETRHGSVLCSDID